MNRQQNNTHVVSGFEQPLFGWHRWFCNNIFKFLHLNRAGQLNSIYKMVKIEFNAATFILAVVVRWLPLIICFLLFSITFHSFHRNIHVYNFELLQLCNISDVKIHMFMPFKKQWAFDTISKDVSRGHVR